jgi:hypothetical protein
MDLIRKRSKIIVYTQNIIVDSEDGFRGSIFARTRMEVDCDIITIMGADVLKKKAIYRLINLHYINVILANELFRHGIYEYFLLIKNLMNAIKLISSGIWLSVNLSVLWVPYADVIVGVMKSNNDANKRADSSNMADGLAVGKTVDVEKVELTIRSHNIKYLLTFHKFDGNHLKKEENDIEPNRMVLTHRQAKGN